MHTILGGKTTFCAYITASPLSPLSTRFPHFALQDHFWDTLDTPQFLNPIKRFPYKELLFVDYNTAELVILAVYRYKVSTDPPSITRHHI